MPNGALCEPWPGSVSSELAADAGAVTIRVSGEGAIVAPLRLPPHPPPQLAILPLAPPPFPRSVGSPERRGGFPLFPHGVSVSAPQQSHPATPRPGLPLEPSAGARRPPLEHAARW